MAMDIEIICNTDNDALFRNVRASSALALPWVRLEPEHDGHAVIVGGGPSVAENLPAIRKRIALGQKVFALNGAAGYLNRHGIIPDYQVLLDARAQTIGLLGEAKQYLIASQCDPGMFGGDKNIMLWHPAVDGIDEHIGPHDGPFCLIGGGTSSGLSAMCLVYSLGYRRLHLFGFDSSHREGSGHAYLQPINDAEPTCKVTMNGRTFLSTLTMAKQAELFPECCNNLIDLGCIITVDGDGLIMEVMQQMHRGPLTETEKYRSIWERDEYRRYSPAEHDAPEFALLSGITADDRVIEFGCGTGRGGEAVRALTGCKVTQTDLVDNCRDTGAALPFVVADLSQPMGLRGDVGFCSDVMEHLPPDQVAAAITNIMACVDRCYFKIALFPDSLGSLIGAPLHLSVFPPSWWDAQFAAYEILHRRVSDGNKAHLTLFVKNHT